MPKTLAQEVEEFFGQSEGELRTLGAKSLFEFPDGRNCRAFILRLYRAARAQDSVERRGNTEP